MIKIVKFILVLLISLLSVIILDYNIGYKFLKEPKYRLTKYDHDLRKNIKMYERGKILYTNNYGFKSLDKSKLKTKKVDIAFIGDSFTEGVAVEYENTFVGIFEKKTNKKVINLGVSSYSPSIYFAKVKYYLDKGFDFKELIVFIDISDIQDEAAYYIEDDKGYIHTRKVGEVSTLKRNIHIILTNFPLIYSSIVKVKNFLSKNLKDFLNKKSKNKIVAKKAFYKKKINLIGLNNLTNFERYNETLIYDYYKVGLYDYKYSRSFWTYFDDDIAYEPLKISGGIDKSLNKMNDLYRLLKKKNIELSIGIYPWPGQILYDSRNSRQVEIWEEFCKDKCKNFYNLFDFFFDEIKNLQSKKLVIEKYYLDGDVHFNEEGNLAVANELLKKY